MSLTGVTGARSELPPDLTQHLRALRKITTKPICVGFGIATPEHAALVGRVADGVIVGSAIVNLVERHQGSPALVSEVGDFIAALKAPLAPQDADKGPSASLARARQALNVQKVRLGLPRPRRLASGPFSAILLRLRPWARRTPREMARSSAGFAGAIRRFRGDF